MFKRSLYAALLVAAFSAPLSAQHALQLDNGINNVAVITAAGVPAGVTSYSLPNLGGTLLTAASGNTMFWSQTANDVSGTDGVNNLLGTLATSTIKPLQIITNGVRVMRYNPGFTATSPNILGGSPSNVQGANLDGSVVAGGGRPGNPNTVNGNYDFIGAGFGNTAGGGLGVFDDINTISGGETNTANGGSGTFSGLNTIGGGLNNTSSGGGGTNSGMNTVAGGSQNSAVAGGGNFSGLNSVGGGLTNNVNGGNGTNSGLNVIAGGGQNNARGGAGDNSGFNFIGGGINNNANGTATISTGFNIVVGGNGNNANGGTNTTNCGGNFIGGGISNNDAANSGLESGTNVIGGGFQNQAKGGTGASSGSNFVGGGYQNLANGNSNLNTGRNSVGGGYSNDASGATGEFSGYNTIGGGYNNAATGSTQLFSGGNTVGGGSTNIVTGSPNSVTSGFNVIAGGAENLITPTNNVTANGYNAICGGNQNSIDPIAGRNGYNFIGAGFRNKARGAYAAVLAGADNTADGIGSSIVCGGKNAIGSGGSNSIVVGGNQLTVNSSETMAFLGGNLGNGFGATINTSRTAFFGNVNMWIGNNDGTAQSNASQLRFFSPTNATPGVFPAAGQHYIALRASTGMGADITYTLPVADGTAGQALSTNGAGTMSWIEPLHAAEPLRQLRGEIAGATGNTIRGAGFTSVRNAVGNYTITITSTYSNVGTPVATISGATPGFITVTNLGAGSFDVLTFNTAGTATDFNFTFMVDGPR